MIGRTYRTLRNEIVKIISRKKEIRPARIRAHAHLSDLGFDTVDLVDIILEVEKNYQLVIPDEVPIDSVDDFVDYVATHTIRKAS